MSSDLKQEYLASKYAYVDGDVDSKPKKKSKKKPPKKADHKHNYQNIVINFVHDKNYPVQSLAGKPAYALESYCTICGKLNYPQQDKEAEELFPHIYTGYFGFIKGNAGQGEWAKYQDWALEHYPHCNMPDYDSTKWRGQTFLDLDKIIPAKV